MHGGKRLYQVLVQPVRLADATFHEVAVNGPFKAFLRNPHSHNILCVSGIARLNVVIAFERECENYLLFVQQSVENNL